MRVLLLGGTTEATALAKALAEAEVDAIFSYAGRTDTPVEQPLPTRVGGFGGTEGLAEFVRDNAITHLIDATHPFAAAMSANAATASAKTDVPVLRFQRAPWVPGPGDDWTLVQDMERLPAALPDAPARVFLAIGKQRLDLFATKPQHHYLLRLVDAPPALPPLPNVSVVLARGPFTVEEDTSLLQAHQITHIVSKNAGGSGAAAKLQAARALRIPVILADRPKLPDVPTVSSVAEAMTWLAHEADRGVKT